MSTPLVEIQAIRKEYGDVVAVAEVDLTIDAGAFVVLLGPSGSGKTTILSMLGGFTEPTAGRILIDGDDMTGRTPAHRPTATVFQDYALFPHMNVEDNVGFGLRMRKVAKTERTRRVGEVIDLVRLTGMEKRRPKALSGGQQQRVALARALVNQPKVLLLDEPLGALDLKLRQTMQLELKDIQHEVGITFVYVTHDQEEALTMSDRVGVMNEGRLVQVGGSEDIYESPDNLFVAGFVGDMNFLAAEVIEPGAVRLNSGVVVEAKTSSPAGTAVTLTLRPEMLHLYRNAADTPEGRNSVAGSITRTIFYGDSLFYEVDIGAAGSLDVRVENLPGMQRWNVADNVTIDFHPQAATALPQ